MNKEFKQETFNLNLARYLQLANEKIWRSIIFSLISFICFLIFIVCFSVMTIIWKNFNINKLEIALYVFIILWLFSLVFLIWWSRLLIYTKKLRKNLSDMRDWPLWKKRKYFAIFILVSKLHFSPNSIKLSLQDAKLNFQEYIKLEAKEGNYSIFSLWKMEMWWLFFDELILFHFFLMIIYFFPMIWTQIKYRYQIGILWIKDDNNVSKNFNLLVNEFFNTLGITK